MVLSNPAIPYKGKLLPMTPYVAAARYQTSLFDYEQWQGRSDYTWEQEVSRLIREAGCEESLKCLPLLRAAARAVDDLERHLQIKGELWSDCGLGPKSAKKFDNFTVSNISFFLPTQLLDRLYWACTAPPNQYRLTLFTRKDLQCKQNTPKHTVTLARYIALSETQVHKLLDSFLNMSKDFFSSFNLPSQPVPSAQICEIGQAIGHSPTQSHCELDHPASLKDSNEHLGHAATVAAAIRSAMNADLYRVSANMWVLTTSLWFVLKVQEPNYFSQFKQAVGHMNIDSCSKDQLKKILEGDSNRALVPAAIALCHSPVYIIDEKVDLVKFELPWNRLALKSVMKTGFRPSPSTSERAIASEKALWKSLAHGLLSVMTVDWKNYEGQEPSIELDLHMKLAEEFRQAKEIYTDIPQTVEILPWPYPYSTQPQANVEISGRKVTEATGQQGNGINETDELNGDIDGEEQDHVQPKAIEKSTLTGQIKVMTTPSGLFQLRTVQSPVEDDHETEQMGGGTDDMEEERLCSEDERMSVEDMIIGKRMHDEGSYKDIDRPHKRIHLSVGGRMGMANCIRDEHRVHKRDNLTYMRRAGRLTSATQYSEPEPVIIPNSSYEWVSHVDIKVEELDLEALPNETPELIGFENIGVTFEASSERDDTAAGECEMNPVGSLTVVRHILGHDGVFHRNNITFSLTWPPGCEQQRQYVTDLLKNSRPAEVYPGPKVIDDKTVTGMKSRLSSDGEIFPTTRFSPLEKRTIERCIIEDLESILARKPCLFIPPRSAEEILEGYKLPILDWRDIQVNLHINVDIPRKAHDIRNFTSVWKSSIKEIIEKKRRAVNLLGMPNPGLVPPVLIQKLSLDVPASHCAEGAGFPLHLIRWNSCGTQPALTQLHYDAGGLCTWVRTLRGTKLLFVLDGPMPTKGLSDFDIGLAKYVYYVLEEGSIFTMPPGTPHAVLDVTDVIAEGGHMFLRPALTKSFEIGLREHILGDKDTNTANVGSEVMLHAIWTDYYYQIIADSEYQILKGENKTGKSVPAMEYSELVKRLSHMPSLQDLTALVCLCVHAAAFEQKPVEGLPPIRCALSTYEQRVCSRRRALEILEFVENLWKSVRDLESNILDTLTKSSQRKQPELPIEPLIDTEWLDNHGYFIF